MARRSHNTPVPLIDRQIEEFTIDRHARNLSPRTLQWYAHSLKLWRAHLAELRIEDAATVTPTDLRRFILHLTERGHNAGGVANVYGAVRAFLRWFAAEYAPSGWQNPLDKVKTPKRSTDPLQPLPLEHLRAMLETCARRTFTGDRDRALLMLLYDTGLRHQEVTDLAIGDVDLPTGAVLVRHGKGGKARTVFCGAKTRRALAAYLRHRQVLEPDSPLWLTARRGTLTKNGLREVVRRRAKLAGIPMPGMHAFRRAFAIGYLRAGGDVLTLQRLLGHASLAIVHRYVRLLTDDLQRAHNAAGPVDRYL